MDKITSRWIAFDDALPPLQDNGRGDALRRKVLVTNNISARDAFGDPSHVWLGNPDNSVDEGWHVYGGGKFLTHWMDPFSAVEADALMVLEMLAADADAGKVMIPSGLRLSIDAALIKAGRKAAPEPVRHITVAGGAL
ncbi:hypothetical protein [Burkholderia cenocepacia]|uniref:hypothetical protein n=1 Tax=Burkholderia cenocepacia TaxID=95486 RepID=UPI00265118E8|nr:hypothetical protein [Burkholderia cenocepacia]MDN7549108.1 hypothetical protein [Burkholderia cenocepacia]